VRDPRPCLGGNLFCGHFGILDSSFDSIWSDTTANKAIDNIFSSQRPGRFPYLSYVSQHIFWNIRHSAPLSGFHPRCKSDGINTVKSELGFKAAHRELVSRFEL
jgi:hypothetical protein